MKRANGPSRKSGTLLTSSIAGSLTRARPINRAPVTVQKSRAHATWASLNETLTPTPGGTRWDRPQKAIRTTLESPNRRAGACRSAHPKHLRHLPKRPVAPLVGASSSNRVARLTDGLDFQSAQLAITAVTFAFAKASSPTRSAAPSGLKPLV